MTQDKKSNVEYLSLLLETIKPAQLSEKTMQEFAALNKEADGKKLIDLSMTCIRELNVKISAVTKDESELDNVLKECETAVREMEKQKQKDVLNLGRFSIGMMTGNIIYEVGEKLKDFSGGADAVKDIVCETTEKEIKNIKQQIIADCSSSIAQIENIMAGSTIEKSISGILFQETDGCQSSDNTQPPNRDKLIRAIGIIALAAAVFLIDKGAVNVDKATLNAAKEGGSFFAKAFRMTMGLGGIVMIFFPQIRGIINKKPDNPSKSADKTTPDIRRKLREQLPKIIDIEIKDISEKVEYLWDKKIRDYKAQAEKAAEEKMPGAKERQKKRKELENILEAARSLTNEMLTNQQ
jgi:hypothetical protein